MDEKIARSLHYNALRIRLIEQEIAKRYGEQEMRCPVHLSVGQEATPVGVSAHLGPNDYMVSTHRAHAHYLAKGGSLIGLIGELYGRAIGCTRGQGGSMHLLDLKCGFIGATSIVGGTIPVGVGAALSAKLKGESRISVVCIGDTAVEEGVFHESINFACLHKLSVLFICENNNYSCYSPLSNRQPNRPLHQLASGHGASVATLDGNDVHAVYNGMIDIIASLRSGNGPYFVEFPTFRYLEHCGPHNDDHLGYRSDWEIKKGHENDAILKSRQTLKTLGFYEEKWERTATEEINREIDPVFSNAINAPYPTADELGAYTYAK